MSSEELARRAVACKGWRWMPGMLALDTGLRLDEMTDDWEAEVPDLTDPATVGCLEALVVEAQNGAVVLMKGNGWFCVETEETSWDDDNAPSYVAALVAALEAAP